MSQSEDLFDVELRALGAAREALDAPDVGAATHRQALGGLIVAYERLLRETRRLVRRSDREEFEMNQLNQRLHELAQELEYRATHDSLTGVLNRAAIIERSERLLRNRGLALIVLDIDHFKRVNDQFGHPVGDQVICGVVACLKAMVPMQAHIGRVGGEEFTVLLPDAPIETAMALGDTLRRAIMAHPFHLPDRSAITASFGVSRVAEGGSFDAAYKRADEALYVAKRGGRNRVVRAEPKEPCLYED